MTVYADVMFAVNFAVDYLMLLLGGRLCSAPVRRLRLALAASWGGLYAVAAQIPALAFLAGIPGKLLSFCLMAGIGFGFRRRALRPGALTLLCSMALAGIVLLAQRLFFPELVTLSGYVYYPMTAGVLVLLAGIFYAAAAWIAAGSMRRGKRQTVQAELITDLGKTTVTALIDTGNTLTDPVTGQPVLVLEWGRAAELIGVPITIALAADPAAAMEYLRPKCPGVAFRLIPYGAVGARGLLLSFPCQMRVGGKRRRIVAALSPTPVSREENFEALIGGDWI